MSSARAERAFSSSRRGGARGCRCSERSWGLRSADGGEESACVCGLRCAHAQSMLAVFCAENSREIRCARCASAATTRSPRQYLYFCPSICASIRTAVLANLRECGEKRRCWLRVQTRKRPERVGNTLRSKASSKAGAAGWSDGVLA
jgi:hypothetical protein